MSEACPTGSAILEIERLVKGNLELVTIDGRTYSRTSLFDPRKPENEPKTLKVGTLSALCDYIASSVDANYRGPRGMFVHVESPTTVSFYTQLFSEFNSRVNLMVASCVLEQFRFDEFMDPEAFTIGLLTFFADSPDRAAVLRLVGNIGSSAVQTVADDGVSQEVTVKSGVVREKSEVIASRPVLLPFRTFLEVAQPPSQFVLRMRGGGNGQKPTVALFESSAGLWRFEAVAAIVEFVRARLSEKNAILPIFG